MEDNFSILELIRRYEEIIIYGCGVIGKKILNFLRAYEIEPTCFAVTAIENRIEEDGCKVRCIDELTSHKDSALILVAVKESLHPTISKQLERCGFCNVFYFTNQKIKQLQKRYIFDYSILKPGSRIVIYGEITLSIRLFNSILVDKYCDVSAIVVKKDCILNQKGVPFLNIYDLRDAEFDFVLVVADDRLIGEALKKELLEIGIEETKTIFCEKIYDADKNEERHYMYRQFTQRILNK